MKNDICIGIDAGSHTSKIAVDNKFIAAVDGCDLVKIREEAEIYFDEPVFSCVIAVPDDFNKRQREDFIFNAKKSGFKNIELINSHDAVLNSIENNKKILVYDFGASRSEFIFLNENKAVDSEVISDICGNDFDKIFALWLRERFNLSLISEKDLLNQAENFKKELSFNDKIIWRDTEILREDFERLIHFSVKRAAHTAERFINCYNPDKFILTGGGAEIPVVNKIFADFNPEFNKNLIVLGTSKFASRLTKNSKNSQHSGTNEIKLKINEIRGSIISIEDLLTRKQKDRLYKLFRQTEGMIAGDAASMTLINLLLNLVSEIKNESAKINH